MKKLFLTLLALNIFIVLQAQDYHVRFGFLGNSITIGSGLSNATEECYPSQIGKLLAEKYGDTCIVGNYAVSGRTMLKRGDYPLWNEPLFKQGWQEAPDICFIMLGTNDTKPYNWDDYGHEFKADYLAMMDTFKLRNPNVKFIVCYPPPAYEVVWDIRNEIIVDEIMPTVDAIITEREAVLVDFYKPLVDSVYLFPDKIHPNAAGAKVMAQIAFDKIVESDIVHQIVTGGTYATSIKTNTKELQQGDSAIISWVTRNATQVTFDGEIVEAIGSIKITPEFTRDYWLVASGILNSDSLLIQQTVYIPELDKIIIDPSRATIKKGEFIDITVSYFDQKKKRIYNAIYPSTWELIEGEGTLENVTDTSVRFVSASAGLSKVQIMAEGVSSQVSITVEESTGINAKHISIQGYPNPCTAEFIIPITNSGELVAINIYDVNGKLASKLNSKQIAKSGKSVIIDTKKLNKGIYVYHLEFSDIVISGKFIRE